MEDTLSFDASKGTDKEECPSCHEVKWLGELSGGGKMCQKCYLEKI